MSTAAAPPDATIHQRFLRIIADLPAIGKNQRNEQQKFMFRGYDDVLNALNPLLGKHGVYFVPDVIERVTGERTTKSGTTMYEVNLHVRFTFYGLAGDSIVASGWGEGTDSGDKATNKAMTMALKYVLFQAFAISTAEATDADAAAPEPTRRSATPPAGGGQPWDQYAPPPPVPPEDKPTNEQVKRWHTIRDLLDEKLPLEAHQGGPKWGQTVRRRVKDTYGKTSMGALSESEMEELLAYYGKVLTDAGVPF